MEDLDALKSELLGEIAAADDLHALDQVRVAALGRKGRVTLLMRELGQMSDEERKTAGAALNALKNELTTAVEARKTALSRTELLALVDRPDMKVVHRRKR